MTMSQTTTDRQPVDKRTALKRLLRLKLQQSNTEPVAFGQESLWFLDQLVPGSTIYSETALLDLDSAPDAALLDVLSFPGLPRAR